MLKVAVKRLLFDSQKYPVVVFLGWLLELPFEDHSDEPNSELQLGIDQYSRLEHPYFLFLKAEDNISYELLFFVVIGATVAEW